MEGQSSKHLFQLLESSHIVLYNSVLVFSRTLVQDFSFVKKGVARDFARVSITVVKTGFKYMTSLVPQKNLIRGHRCKTVNSWL